MRYFVCLVFLFVSLSVNAAPINTEIRSVEQGLKGAVQFKGDPTWSIEDRMAHYGVPGVSIAVIKDYKIHWIKSYGVTDKETNQAVTQETLFQAGSISKPVAAYGALRLVEMNKLSLDKPANQFLKGWKIPENEFTQKKAVALKHLLNHSAGLTVHGFWGYSEGLNVPSVIQVLKGEEPANSEPVIVNMLPETQMRYSGGGYTVMQKMVSDVSGKTYPKVMNELVLKPLNMTRSTYEQPLPEEKLKFAAAGYLPNKQPVPGKRHVYPEMAAAGLWTTAEDLAKFAIDVQLAIKSDKSKVLSQSMANRMLTPWVSKNTGLGFFIDTKVSEVYFEHGGWDEGFSADLIAHKQKGYGVVIMTNSNHPPFIEELKNSVAAFYNWDDFLNPVFLSIEMDIKEIERISGRYYFSPDMLFTIEKKDNKVMMKYLDGTEMQLYRIDENVYIRKEHNRKFSFVTNPKTKAIDLVFDMGNGETITRRRMREGETMAFESVVAGEFKKAEKRYGQLFEKSPDLAEQVEWSILNLAKSMDVKKQTIKIQSLLKMCTRIFSESIHSWSALARFYSETDNKRKAISSYQKALALQPSNKSIQNELNKLKTN